jgi:Cu+-exporting ATPase
MVKDLVCGMEVDEKDERSVFIESSGEKYYFCCVECKMLFSRDPKSFIEETGRRTTTSTDTVCGMEVEMKNAAFKLRYHGRWYYFCSQSCLREFERRLQHRGISST